MNNLDVTEKKMPVPDLDLNDLRQAIQAEYTVVAKNPGRGFHFHTGRPLTQILGYDEKLLAGIPERNNFV